MSWDKRSGPKDIIHFPGKQEVEKYVYTPGISGLDLARALKDGKIIGGRCANRLQVPPKTFCRDFEKEELVEIDGDWEIVTYTIVYEDIYGNRLKEPQIVAVVKPIGIDSNGMIHIVKANQSSIRIGMAVRPVFRKPEERKGLITDIVYFEPIED